MLRSLLHDGQEHYDSDGFRLRGLGFSRLDGFSDVVFGFALTLLVVSLEVPRDYAELHHMLAGFIPFGISFLLLMLVWFGHYNIFRRLGTHDTGTLWLNGMLLFVVLFYVYPLKFLFVSAFNPSVNVGGNMEELVLLYAGGLATIYFLFATLYANGYRQREKLQLTPLERRLTLNSILEECGTATIGVLVCVTAACLHRRASLACLLFLLIAPWKSFAGYRAGHFRRTMESNPELAAESGTDGIPDNAQGHA